MVEARRLRASKFFETEAAGAVDEAAAETTDGVIGDDDEEPDDGSKQGTAVSTPTNQENPTTRNENMHPPLWHQRNQHHQRNHQNLESIQHWMQMLQIP